MFSNVIVQYMWKIVQQTQIESKAERRWYQLVVNRERIEQLSTYK